MAGEQGHMIPMPSTLAIPLREPTKQLANDCSLEARCQVVERGRGGRKRNLFVAVLRLDPAPHETLRGLPEERRRDLPIGSTRWHHCVVPQCGKWTGRGAAVHCANREVEEERKSHI